MKKILINYWGLVFFYLVIVLGIILYNPEIKRNASSTNYGTSIIDQV